MKRHWLLGVVAAVSLPLAVAANEPLALTNGNFEEGLEGWTAEAEGVEVTAQAASLGGKGLSFPCGGDTKTGVTSGPLPVQPGESYGVTFWAGGSADAPGKAYVTMVFQDAAGKELKPERAKIRKWPVASVTGGTFFEKHVMAAAAPAGATTLTVRIRPQANSPGRVFLDDFTAERIDEVPVVKRDANGGALLPPFDPQRLAELEKEIAANPYRGKTPPKIVIKLDDLSPRGGKVHAKWQKVADYAREKGIPVTFGIIAEDMTKDEDLAEFVSWIKPRQAAGEIEFWHHGWDHQQWKGEDDKMVQEFRGSGYEHQKKHLDDATSAVRDKLGFAFVSFGAPFNATDADTVRALEENPDIKVWMYGDAAHPAGKTVLERCFAVTIESPTFIPNYADFVEGYAHNRGAPYFVMQGHPTHWGDERWEQFTKIVEFLLGQKASFVKASDFAATGVKL